MAAPLTHPGADASTRTMPSHDSMGVERSQWTSREPAGCVTRMLRMEWERDTGRARLDRVEGGDSRRTGPGRPTIRDVPLEVGHVSVPTDKGNGTTQRFDSPLKVRVETCKD